MKKTLCSALALAAFAAPAIAVNNEGTSGNYLVGSGAYEISDSKLGRARRRFFC